MDGSAKYIGQDRVTRDGWLAAHKWLILRRLSQVSILLLFLAGPLFGYWLVKGNMASSLILETLPLTDPLVLLQSLLAGQQLIDTGLIGAAIVLVFYLLVGGRVYCSWVCPINLVTDIAAWLRKRLGLKGGMNYSRSIRYWMLGGILLAALITGTIAWELVNPVSMVFRGLIFGMGAAWFVVLAIFLLDVFVSQRAWCGHLCPVGAFYGLIGRYSLLRINAVARSQCNDCMDCYQICPEPQILGPVLKGEGKTEGTMIDAGVCTNCARCIDVCAKDVFTFDSRFNNTKSGIAHNKREVLS